MPHATGRTGPRHASRHPRVSARTTVTGVTVAILLAAGTAFGATPAGAADRTSFGPLTIERTESGLRILWEGHVVYWRPAASEPRRAAAPMPVRLTTPSAPQAPAAPQEPAPVPAAEPPAAEPPAAGARVADDEVDTASAAPATEPAPVEDPAPVAPASSQPQSGQSGAVQSPPADDGLAGQVLDLVNQARAQAGCGPLQADPALRAAAQGHADDMAGRDYFSHTSLDGRSPFQRMTAAGYRFRMAAENIAMGQRDPQQAVTGWMNSEGHRHNILTCDYVDTGVGVAQGDGGLYWVQVFGAGF